MNQENTLFWQQKMIQIPTMKQLLNQRFSCEVLFNLLSSGEKCIYKDSKERKYRYYDPLKTSRYKNQQELEIEFRNQVRCFQACFLDDCENNGGFRYPDNLDKKEIIEDLYKWKEMAKKLNYQLLYDIYSKCIKLLGGEKIIVDKIKVENSVKNTNYKKSKEPDYNLKDLMNSAMMCNQQSYDMEDMIKNDYKNGNYSIIAKLYCNPPKTKGLWQRFKNKIGFSDDEDDDYDFN
jgi:hypothetical protein